MTDVNRIQRGDLQQRIASVLRIYGEPSPAPTLAPEMQAVVVVEDLESQSLALNPINKRYSTSLDQAAGGAGTFNYWTLFNPLDSGVIARVDSLRVGSLLAQTVRIGRPDPLNLPGGTLAENPHDSRGPGAATRSTASTPGSNFILEELSIEMIPANTTKDCFPTWDRHGIILVPGQGFGLFGVTANQLLRVSSSWTEFTAS
jgi:hypothetical protein